MVCRGYYLFQDAFSHHSVFFSRRNEMKKILLVLTGVHTVTCINSMYTC